MEQTKSLENNKLKINGKYGYSVERFRQSSKNNVFHVRPHNRDLKAGRTLLRNESKISNYCFWLNTKYDNSIIKFK